MAWIYLKHILWRTTSGNIKKKLDTARSFPAAIWFLANLSRPKVDLPLHTYYKANEKCICALYTLCLEIKYAMLFFLTSSRSAAIYDYEKAQSLLFEA